MWQCILYIGSEMYIVHGLHLLLSCNENFLLVMVNVVITDALTVET